MWRGTWGAVLVAVAVATAFGGCSSEPERSMESFCSTMASEKERILDQFHDTVDAGESTGDETISILSGLGASQQAIGELRTYFQKLAKVAPDEIRTEVEVVAEEFDELLDNVEENAGNPLGGLAASLMGGLTMSGPLSAVDDWAVENCGEHI